MLAPQQRNNTQVATGQVPSPATTPAPTAVQQTVTVQQVNPVQGATPAHQHGTVMDNLLDFDPIAVASSSVHADLPLSSPTGDFAPDPYFALLERQGQILEKLADPLRPTVLKPVVPKPPEAYKIKADIRSWLSQFDT